MSPVQKYLCVGGPLDGQISPAVLHGGNTFKAHIPPLAPVSYADFDPKAVSTPITDTMFYRLVTFHWQRSNGDQLTHNYWVPDEFARDQAQGRIYVLTMLSQRYSEGR